MSAPKPIDILLRKQPPAITASFFERMKFLIDEGSLQNYARLETFNERYVMDSRLDLILTELLMKKERIRNCKYRRESINQNYYIAVLRTENIVLELVLSFSFWIYIFTLSMTDIL